MGGALMLGRSYRLEGLGLGRKDCGCLLPAPEVGVGRDSTFPYWFWVPFP